MGKRTTKKSPKKQIFTAILEKYDNMDAAYLSIPFDVEEIYGTKGQVKVKALFDGYPYRGVLANMGTGCHIIGVKKDIRTAIGKQAGDKVLVQIELDTEDRIVDVPMDLKEKFKRHLQAKKFFESLSYTNKKEFATWIISAKKSETREKRIKETIHKLSNGLKNPSQRS
jgi:hypothetical protein